MPYEVVAEFVDRRDGSRIRPGKPLPEGLDQATLDRLERAGCLRKVAGKPPGRAALNEEATAAGFSGAKRGRRKR